MLRPRGLPLLLHINFWLYFSSSRVVPEHSPMACAVLNDSLLQSLLQLCSQISPSSCDQLKPFVFSSTLEDQPGPPNVIFADPSTWKFCLHKIFSRHYFHSHEIPPQCNFPFLKFFSSICGSMPTLGQMSTIYSFSSPSVFLSSISVIITRPYWLPGVAGCPCPDPWLNRGPIQSVVICHPLTTSY